LTAVPAGAGHAREATAPRARLSVILITHNESANIGDCLASLRFADEWIVVDSGSTDDTVNRARAFGAHVVPTRDWPGFGPQKNRALALATGDWVLSIDADERIPAELAQEIRRTLEAAEAEAGLPSLYELPRLSSYCGHFMRHAGWWPDPVLRLFRRGEATFTDHRVHERLVPVVPDAKIGRLKTAMLHYSFRDLETVLDKVNRYSTAGAQAMGERGKRTSLSSAVAHGLWAFFRTYVVKGGCLDGRYGFMLAVSNAEGTYYRYVKRLLAQDAPAPIRDERL
jgi:glycosyltransferase involved in cell wall biosynthesis